MPEVKFPVINYDMRFLGAACRIKNSAFFINTPVKTAPRQLYNRPVINPCNGNTSLIVTQSCVAPST